MFFFLEKQLTMKKETNFLRKISFYGIDMELEPEPELFKSRNRNRKK
jgi:hypothetical protein